MRHVLIADDEGGIRTIIGKVARMHGWTATECADGSRLLAELRSDADADLIFLDLQMPEMDGIETIQALAGNDLACPIYLMTGGIAENANAAETIGRARGLKIRDILKKPVSIKDLGKIFQDSAQDKG